MFTNPVPTNPLPTNPLSNDTGSTSTTTPKTKRAFALGLIAAGLFLAACGADEEATTTATVTDAPAATTEEDAATTAEEDAATTAVWIGTEPTDAGDVLVDEAGLSLYGFLPDEGGVVTCGGGCAEAWPPVTLPSGDLPDGLDAEIFSVTAGFDGGYQLMAGGWPLYRFAGDASAGDITGQGSGDNWFLVAPDGSLITDETAAGTTEPAAADTGGGYGYGADY